MLSFTLENCSVEKKINSKIDANILNSSISNNNDYSEIIEPIREYLCINHNNLKIYTIYNLN